MARKKSLKNDSFDKRDDDDMEDIEDGKKFNPDSLEDALEENSDYENDGEESLNILEEEENELNERDILDEEETPFWKL